MKVNGQAFPRTGDIAPLVAFLYEQSTPEQVEAIARYVRDETPLAAPKPPDRGEDLTWLEGLAADLEHAPTEPLEPLGGLPYAYGGACVLISGPTGSGKSVLMSACALDAAMAGLPCAYGSGEVSYEESNARLGDVARRRGLPDDLAQAVVSHIRYFPLDELVSRLFQDPERIAPAIAARYPIVCLDPMSSIASTLGRDFDSNTDYVECFDRLIKPLTTHGSTVLIPDNTGHSLEAKGRAKGASAKQDKADIILSCKPNANPAGLRIQCTKVRSIRAPFRRGDVWLFDRETLTVTAVSDDQERADGAGFRPTVLMERISRALEAQPGLTRRALRDSVKGNHEARELALELLIAEGYVRAVEQGKWIRHEIEKPFRDDSSQSAPEPSPKRPQGQSSASGPTGPTLLGGQGQWDHDVDEAELERQARVAADMGDAA